MAEAAPADQAQQRRISTTSVASAATRMSNAERYNKMKESRERTRLRLTAATEQIARLEAELKVAKMQQDNGAEAQVAALQAELNRLQRENAELREALAGKIADMDPETLSSRERGLRAALAGAERAAAETQSKLERALATQSATQWALVLATGVAVAATFLAVQRRDVVGVALSEGKTLARALASTAETSANRILTAAGM